MSFQFKTAATRVILIAILVAASFRLNFLLLASTQQSNNMESKQQSRNITAKLPPKEFSSPACQPRLPTGPIRRIFFAHTRKAGGTVLRMILMNLCKQHNLELTVREGAPVEPIKRNDTLYITTLRHPVDRIISHYKYEGRWECRDIVHKRHPPKINATANNSLSLEDFLSTRTDRVIRTNKSCAAFQTQKKRQKLWVCGELCYLRWFSEPFGCIHDLTHSYQTALQSLSEFHLIVVQERMRDPVYWGKVLNMIGMPSNYTFKYHLYCDDDSKELNKLYPAVLRNETLQRIYKENEMDIDLYDRLTSCPQGFYFPKTHPVFQSSQDSESLIG